MTQMAQTAACNRHHSVDHQLCRWLLLSLDRLASNELIMTQKLIANMLGVRREVVTEAAGKLQRAGLIEYNRGHIRVLDRPGLEARVCECYQVVKTESDRLLPLGLSWPIDIPHSNGTLPKKSKNERVSWPFGRNRKKTAHGAGGCRTAAWLIRKPYWLFMTQDRSFKQDDVIIFTPSHRPVGSIYDSQYT
jgi:Crp-like helix-turn-helix domain